MIEHIHVKGYRLFKDFETKLQPGINVIIGANGSGKSTLIELLRIIQSCCLGRVKPGIELRPLPGEIFHPGGGASITWGVTVPLVRDEIPPRCYHTMEITVPTSAPRVTGELLTRLERRPKPGCFRAGELPEELSDLHLIRPPESHRPLAWQSRRHGVVLERRPKVPIELQEAEPMVSRLTDPRYDQCYSFRNIVLGWRFYGELVVHRTAHVREPQPMGRGAEIDERGQNLAPALLSLFTNIEYREQRDDLLSFLTAAIPDLETLTPTPDPSGKYAVLQWRERDVNTTLGASDVSDGVLRLLMLGVICCNPFPPPLICIDEPEIGLHPKLLPLVGGLLQHASDRSQMIVLTHSPDLLYGMPLESIAVMRKRDGEAQIVWPKDHDILADLLTEEVAGERQVDRDRLRDAMLSGEMDELG